jgi:alpha-glucosidase (family GH31 glycosyl hydrolase)
MYSCKHTMLSYEMLCSCSILTFFADRERKQFTLKEIHVDLLIVITNAIVVSQFTLITGNTQMLLRRTLGLAQSSSRRSLRSALTRAVT